MEPKNVYVDCGEYFEMLIEPGFIALIDSGDFDRCSAYRWKMINKDRLMVGSKIAGKTVQLHRFILGLEPMDHIVDHKNRNHMDNRRKNLRICTKAQNGWNAGPQKNNLLGVKGISIIQGKYVARISKHRKQIYLGSFERLEDAIKAYNKAADEFHGDFAYHNTLAV